MAPLLWSARVRAWERDDDRMSGEMEAWVGELLTREPASQTARLFHFPLHSFFSFLTR